jgi:hypothetical protein
MILASAVSASSSTSTSLPDSLNLSMLLDDITFHIIDVASGITTDKRTFNSDHIYLNNHAGVHLFENKLGIVSVKTQSIHFLNVSDSGHFEYLFNVGYYCRPDDELLLSQQKASEQKYRDLVLQSTIPLTQTPRTYLISLSSSEGSESFNTDKLPFSGLKQRIMSYLYNEALSQGTVYAMNHFYITFDYFESLTMCRMQFIDSDKIIIKYVSEAGYFLYNS